MDVYRRYFKVVGGPLIDAYEEAKRINAIAHEEYRKILAEIGAKPEFYHIGGRLTGIMFDGKPDGGIFKRRRFGWYPKKNCKSGKELAARIDAVKTSDPQKTLEVIGLTDNPNIFGEGICYLPTLTFIPENPPVIYVSVPWYDEDPEKIERYKKENAKGMRSDRNLDSVQWEPTSDMEEVKRWQVDRHISEWNDKVNKQKTK